jgi:adenine-specific DNA methylase
VAVRDIEKDESAARRWLKRLPLPENIRLPRTSDAAFFHDLFTPRQLAGLARIKQGIDLQEPKEVRDLLLLAWSASVAKLNKTFLSAKGRAASRGGSSIFSIYRYKLASRCVELPIWETFRGRFLNVLAAKEEVLRAVRYWNSRPRSSRKIDSRRDFRALTHDAATLGRTLARESVDYIFTDPPYGAFISYLDLSILWNHWLGFPVTERDREHETIVGGEKALTEEHYRGSLARGVRTCFRLLRPDRWLSIVFQHWDLRYFATILETAGECGAELKAAITQTGDVIWSMHKKKNSQSVLAGEMILTFHKGAAARTSRRSPRRPAIESPSSVLSEVFDVCLDNGTHDFTNESLFNKLVIELWRRDALGCLRLDRREFARELSRRGWTYNPRDHRWTRAREAPQPAGLPTLFSL